MLGLNFLMTPLGRGMAGAAVVLLGLYLYGNHREAQGRELMASEIAGAAAEKRGETAETIKEIKNELENTDPDALLDVIIDNGWLLPETD